MGSESGKDNNKLLGAELPKDAPNYFTSSVSDLEDFLKSKGITELNSINIIFRNSNGCVLRLKTNTQPEKNYILKVSSQGTNKLSLSVTNRLSIYEFRTHTLDEKFTTTFTLLKDMGSENYRSVLYDELTPKQLTQKQENKIAIDWICAVMHLHLLDLIHRDLKPDNFVHSCDDSAVLVDYDQVKVCSSECMLRIHKSFSFGTPGYIAQEATFSPKNPRQDLLQASQPSDIFSLSSMLNTDLFHQEMNGNQQYNQGVRLSDPLTNLLYYFVCLIMKLPSFFKKEKKQEIVRPEFLDQVKTGLNEDLLERPSLDVMLNALEPGLGDENRKYLQQRRDFLRLVKIYKNKNQKHQFLKLDLNFSERCELLAEAACPKNVSEGAELIADLRKIRWLDSNNQPTSRAPEQFAQAWYKAKPQILNSDEVSLDPEDLNRLSNELGLR